MVNFEIFSLLGKNAIVTGAGGLLGRQHCLALMESGASVFGLDINKKALDILQSEIVDSKFDGSFFPYELDISSPEEVYNFFEYTKKMNTPIDILINNAAVNPGVSSFGLEFPGRLEDFCTEQFRFEMEVGLQSYIVFCQIFGEQMALRKLGVILNISSDLSVIAPDQRLYFDKEDDYRNSSKKPVSYSVIKHALTGLTRYMASYYGYAGVRCNALSPGGILLNQPENFVKKLEQLIPMGRMARAEEYRGVVRFLCSDASSYMTGQNIVMDGGRSII